ncbi:SAM-dependent methyltransferase [Bombiscardovia nodaiensis]|uniref:SAM-dependent methyltransferase n=1 Tax=Bombiscardovia nodaiensis TaxID=2932181 RepID=A0ABM8B8E7_9BIFI|nr:SAM-dependent methyltransferase [Bombiscardovia nodaiensis]
MAMEEHPQAPSSQADIDDNRANWDDRAQVHAQGGYGDVQALARNHSYVSGVVRRDFEVLKPHLDEHGVEGKSLLHLQCHIGLDTLSWYHLGARNVCGLDFSPKSLEYARALAQEAQAPIKFVEADARFADQALPGEHFDLVVTSVGTITWLPSLDEWAHSIAHLLEPGGLFMIRDSHPLLFAVDPDSFALTGDYFSGAEDTYESDQSYTPGSAGKVKHTTNHNWSHDFAEITRVLIGAGLTLEALGEYEVNDWQPFPQMVYDTKDEGWRMPAGAPQIPQTFSIVARKPVQA